MKLIKIFEVLKGLIYCIGLIIQIVMDLQCG